MSAHAAVGLGGFDRLQPRQRIGDLLDRPRAGVFNRATRYPRKGVVVNAGTGGDDLPRTVTLDCLQRGFELIETHRASLGVRALDVKASAPKASVHYSGVKEKAAPTTDFQANLRRIIGDTPINAWVKRFKNHRLEQTTIQRLWDGSDPKLSMIIKLAQALDIEPWKLLVPGLELNNQPIIQGAAGATEVKLWERIGDLLKQVEGLREAGNTRPAELEEENKVRGSSVFGELDELRQQSRSSGSKP